MRPPLLISCLGVEDDLPYLPHFLAHYRGLGVAPDSLHLILQSPDPASPRLETARAQLEDAGIAPAETWIGAYTSTEMWARRRALQERMAGADDWVLSADIDELHDYPAPLPEILAWCERHGYEAIQGPFIDRLAESGGLAKLPPPETPLAESFPIQTELRHAIAGHTANVNLGGSVNLMLYRGRVRPGTGGHSPLREQRHRVAYAYGRPLSEFAALRDPAFYFSPPFLVHHYKWTHGLLERMRQRLETPGITPAGREYAEALVAFFGTNEIAPLDRLVLRDPARDAPADWFARIGEIRRRHRQERLREIPKRIRRRLGRSRKERAI